MVGNIKGITIEFDGDTTKLGRALNDINSKAKGLDKDLRQVNNALKFNPKNTELVAQKQTLLKQKIEQTRKQLEAYKQAQRTMDADGVDKTSQEYMELRRQIITTESKLKHFNDELEKTNRIKFDQVGEKFQQVGDKMQTAGKGLTKGVTAPILAVGAASVKAFDEVKGGLNSVAQKTGASGKELEKMQESARNLAKEIPTDFATAGSAIGEVNTRFGLTGDALEELSGQFVKFAKVNDADVSSSIDATQKALAAFGLDASKAGGLLDTLTRVSQLTGVSVDTLTSGLVQNGAAFQELGLSIDQSAMLMGQLDKSGANSETVMQGLRKALKNAAKDGVPLDKALSNLQKTIVNGKDGMDGLTAAYDLFGKSGDQIYAAVKNGTIDFNQLAMSAGNTAGVLDKTFKETLTPAEQFQTTLNTVKDAGYTLANTFLTMLAPYMEKVAEKVKELTAWWQGLSPEMQKAIVIVGAVAAAIGPLLVMVGKMSTGIGAIIKLLPMLTGPAGIAVAAIAGITAAGVALYKNWDTVKEKAAAVKDWVVDKFTALKDTLKGIIDKIKGFFQFKFELPQIKLPHFSIQPSGWKISDLLKGSIPSLGIDWYANGGIFNRPTIAGIGEAGPEAVIPIDRLQGMLNVMADSIVNGVNAGAAMTGGGGDIVIPIYLYPSGPKMGEEVVKSYDQYKRQLG